MAHLPFDLKAFALVILSLQLPAVAQTPPSPGTADDGWPRVIQDASRSIVVYQPQIESWKDNRIEERAAIGVENPGAASPVYGVVWFKARTEVDKSSHLVTLEDLTVTRADFPTAPERETSLRDTIQRKGAALLRPISLDRLQASLAVTRAEEKQLATEEKPGHLKNDVPRIFYAAGPAFLLLIDGNPVLRESGTAGILRVVNTRALVLLEQSSGKYYLGLRDRWLVAPSPTGPWTFTAGASAPLSQVRKAAMDAKLVDPVTDESLLTAVEAGHTPQIFVSLGPAELIETRGTPQLEPIASTRLLSIRNTDNDLLFSTSEQAYYVLFSGRWYRSKSLDSGSWSFVAANQLPGDFAKIPESHPEGAVLASVAGTPAAQEAAISQQIPQTATIDRSAPGPTITYDGAPNFQPVEGAPLRYAANSPVPVLEVDPHSFYAVQDGVWFTAATPAGPWQVATSVPPVIYTIPPSSPIYYATFVYVYGATPQVVYTGYLPGYLGSYVDGDGVVVFGTGYVYPPWIGAVWIGAPCTFFGFGLAFYHPWWGPWHRGWAPGYGFTGRVPVGEIAASGRVNIYRAWGPSTVRSTWNRGEVHATQAARFGRPNNIYSDRSGNIYRQGAGGGWERYAGNEGWHATAPRAQAAPRPETAPPARLEPGLPSEVEHEQAARAAGEAHERGWASGGGFGHGGGRRRFRG